jgi:hypothetical protein
MATATAAALGAALSLWLALLLSAARSGLDTPALLPIACWLVLAAAVFAPFALPARWRPALVAAPWAIPLLSLAVLVSPVLVLVAGRGLGLAYPLLAGAGLAGAVRALRRGRARGLVWLLAGTPLLAAHLFLEVHAPGFAHAFAPEFLLLGDLSLDTTFHMAMAHLIESLGRFSTGLDGPVPFDYHHGSHVWFAGLARLAGTTPVYSYPYGQITVAVPGLFWALYAAVAVLSRDREGLAGRLLLGTALVLLFDRIGWNSYYISESYTVGLIALLAATPLLADTLRCPERGRRQDLARDLSMLAVVFVAACTKVSVGAVLGVAFGWLVLRLRGLAPRALAVGAALAAIAAFVWLELKPATGLSLAESFSLFDFYRSPGVLYMNRYRGWTAPLLPLLYLVWLPVRLRRSGAAERARLALTAEVVAVATTAALLPGLVLRMWSGTAWWFADVPHWLVLPLVASAIPFEGLPARRRRVLGAVLAALVLGWLGVGFLDGRAGSFERLGGRLLLRTGALPRAAAYAGLGAARSYWRRTLREESSLFGADVRAGLERSNGARLVARVRDALAGDDPSGFAILVPPSNDAVWKGGRRPCLVRPLRVPALTGVPLLKGLSPRCPDLDYMRGYGFGVYGAESRARDLEVDDLCRHAGSRGIDRILVLRSLGVRGRNRLVVCDR